MFFLILFGLIVLPSFVLSQGGYPDSLIPDYYMPPSPYYDWTKIVLISLLATLLLFLVWLFSPLGIVFIICTISQFLVKKREVRLLSWIFQGLVLIFTILLGIAAFVLALTPSFFYGQEKYIFLISAIGTLSLIFLLISGVIITQIIWQKRK